MEPFLDHQKPKAAGEERRDSAYVLLFSVSCEYWTGFDYETYFKTKDDSSKSRTFNSITYALTRYLEEMLISSLGWEDDGEEGESSWAASVVGVGTVKWSVKIFNFLGVPSPIGLNSNKDSARERERVCIQTKKKKDYSFGAWTNNLHSVSFTTPWTTLELDPI